jgi:hypothetical protein
MDYVGYTLGYIMTHIFGNILGNFSTKIMWSPWNDPS